MVWKVKITVSAARQIKQLDRKVQARIYRFLKEQIARTADPRLHGKPLHGELAGFWRYRVGDYRLLCKIEDQIFVVYVLEAGHRREIYR